MIGNFRWNLATGLVGFLGTLAVSLPRNIIKTALVQSCYSFVFLFIFTFVVRWVLGLALHSGRNPGKEGLGGHDAELMTKGQTIDLATPEDGAVSTQADSGEEDIFAPLNPPKLSTKIDKNPEELVKAIRHMSEE
jgi:hypothetical protein